MKKKMGNREKTFLCITIPILILFFMFNTLPLIRGVIYSFTNYKGYGTYDFVGFRNYVDLFQDSRVGKSYLFTFEIIVCPSSSSNLFCNPMASGYLIFNSPSDFNVLQYGVISSCL